jgi:arylesterase / paraoxonase
MKRSISKPDPYLGAGIGLAVVLFVLYVYPGFLAPINSDFDGSCRTVPLSLSAEDLRIDAATGVAYLTYYDRAPRPGAKRGQGSVMLVDLNTAEPRVRAALTVEPPDFAPVGISLYTPSSGPKRLFVVNRATLGKHAIEIFEQSATGAFAPVETIRDRLMWSPTSIVAVGPRQFYFTNDSGFRDSDASDPRKLVANKLKGNRSSVVYFDGERATLVAGRLRAANGLALSPDGRTLYVAESGRARLQVFDRELATGNLKPRDEISLGATPHNITADAEGNVWISVHPAPFAYQRAQRDPDSKSPTQVLKYTPGAERDNPVSVIYTSSGEELSAGSVAAIRGTQLVIGSVVDHRLLVCSRGEASTPPPKPAITGPERET